ncbi:MAG: hypothetical protein B6U89_00755 [Desulfurococcales archaeon ex4484_58]|nr:MAG: hypothetical protein B6U89_00755 [Desulfurococcales archaeon ex4484_58]
MSSRKEIVKFEGVVVGFESPSGYSGPALYVQGSIDDRDSSFYLLVSEDIYKEYLVKGVGQLISGRGRIVSEEPLVLEMLGEG